MRHRYDPDLHPTRRLPAFRVVRSHRRPRSGWPPFVGALAMIALGVTAVVVTLAASRGPTVGPVHVARPPVAGVPETWWWKCPTCGLVLPATSIERRP
jgi:hypothetical protein